MEKARPIRIDLKENSWDAKVIALTEKGFTAKAIASRSGLTVGQIRGRLIATGPKGKRLSAMSYRRGESKTAGEVSKWADLMYGSLHQLQQRIAQAHSFVNGKAKKSKQKVGA